MSISAQENASAAPPLEESFRVLSYAVTALRYPPTPRALAAQIANEDAAGVKLFLEVQRAKQAITSARDRDEGLALAKTLAAIEQNCEFKKLERRPSVEENAGCVGAILSLYFFDSAGDDKKILVFFRNSHPSVQALMLDYDHGWTSTRKTVSAWLEVVGGLTEDVLNESAKVELQNRLRLKYAANPVFGLYP